MRNNGSPDPVFETDEDRTWFRVTLPIHPDFIQDEDDLVNDLESEPENEPENYIDQLADLVSNLVSNLVSGSANHGQPYRDLARILMFVGDSQRKREDILRHIGLTNQTFNYRNYIEPLEKADLLAKTIPHRPRTPRQRYILTEKGKSLLLSVK